MLHHRFQLVQFLDHKVLELPHGDMEYLLLFEYCLGGSVSQHVLRQETEASVPPPSLTFVLRSISQIAMSVLYLHTRSPQVCLPYLPPAIGKENPLQRLDLVAMP